MAGIGLQAAKVIRLDESTLARVEQGGSRRPTPRTLGKLAALFSLTRMMFTRASDLDVWERVHGHPMLVDPDPTHDSKEWLATAERQELNLLLVATRQHDINAIHSNE